MRHEHTDERTTHRNGSRTGLLSTKAGDGEPRIPKFRAVSFLLTLLEPRCRIDRALWAVVMEAYVHGVSKRRVGMILAEQDDEWQDGRRYFRPETIAAIDAVTSLEEVGQLLFMASSRSGARTRAVTPRAGT